MTAEQKKNFINMGYTEAQIEEIDAGMAAGIDVSVYMKLELMPMQMSQIRQGLISGLDMSPYANAKYDWFQLEEIREGMLVGIDVSKYDFDNLPADKMRQLRLGLEKGMDLSAYIDYASEIICQIREAKLSDIDILDFVSAGYEADQLFEIRTAIDDGLDIQRYIDVEFRAPSISEIAQGLRDNVDVEVFAKNCYSWSQMRELRLGLTEQVDVSFYQSPLYDRYQMEQIRLGLEQGLEVDEYTSLMYPAYFMEKIRNELAVSGRRTDEEDQDAEIDLSKENKDGLLITISEDDMTAYIRFSKEKFGITTRKDIMRSLRVVGITQNIDPRMVDDLLSGKHLDEMVPIATGRPPIDGEDGHYEFYFETNKSRAPKILADGSVDFQNSEWYEQVKKGQKLAYYYSAGKGEPGHTVTGKRIAPKRGKEMMALRGKGFYLLEDKKTYVSEFDGRIDFDGTHLEISKLLTVPEVNQATGNIRFEGDVIVSGDVSNGAWIVAGKDVVIEGFVENAHIEAGGNITLKKGVNGGGTGSISAGGSVEGKFFESVSVKAGSSISVNYSLNSNLYSEDTITVFGNKGLVIGGTIFAARDIKVSSLGNETGLRTVVRMGISEAMKKEQRNIDDHMVELDNKLKVLMKGQKDFRDKYPPDIRNTMDIYIKIENAIFTLEKEKDEYKEKKDKLLRQIANTADAMLTVTGELYDNILVEIDGRKLVSTRAKNVTIKKVDNRIGIFQNV